MDNFVTSNETDSVSLEVTTVSKLYSFSISGGVSSEPSFYESTLTALRETVTDCDEVILYVNSHGGDIRNGLALMDAIRDCSADVKAVVTGSAESVAAIIVLACGSIEFKPCSKLMFHNSSSEIPAGKNHEIYAEIESCRRVYRHMLKTYCTPFLTDHEIDRVLNGEDLHIHEFDMGFKDRLDRHFTENSSESNLDE